MYYNVSRGASPSATARASKIDLENLEELQEAWSRRYEMLRDPPPPPELNSPRSLRACALGSVNPHYTLQKLSLKQHLFRVLGNANMLSALPTPSSTEYRILMQSALRSFQEVAVGLGTSQEKLAAYIAFQNQEELRTMHIVPLRELRRQLVAEEVYAVRKRHHPQQRRSSREAGASSRSNGSASRRDGSTHSLGSALESHNGSNALWSSKVEERVRSRHASVSSAQDSTVNVSGHPISPIATALSGTRRSRAPLSDHRGEAADSLNSPATTKTTRAAAAAADGEHSSVSGTRGGAADFTPTLSPSGKLPYKPRDVVSLNSSYFGNRSIQSAVSNPSGAALPRTTSAPTSVNTSVVSPTPRRPVLAQKHARYPLVPPPPAQNLHKALSDGAGDADREVSIGANPQDSRPVSGQKSLVKQDLSVVSLNSNQLEVLMNPKGTTQTLKALSSTSAIAGGGGNGAAAEADGVHHAVKLFHETDGTVEAPSPLQPPSTALTKVNAEKAPNLGTVSTPSSQPLTPRRRASYTNHLNSPTKLVPNVSPCPVTVAAAAGEVSPAAQPEKEDAKRKMSPSAETSDAQSSSRGQPAQFNGAPSPSPDAAAAESTIAASSATSLQWAPPQITPEERAEGFVYYCANPTRNVTKFYGGARFPIAGAVKL